jgi:phenylpropionate dioxygenase-like ring-hydroxylating dioxygenase large terminal subunit
MRAVASIPTAWYRDPAHLALEEERVFATAWQYVGSASSVEGPGTYLAGDLTGLPIVVTLAAPCTASSTFAGTGAP